jgi:ACS family pantothenate transporter-like MFS transporter
VILGYFIKYLDQTNYSEQTMHSTETPLTGIPGNAFVSGMKEDLGLYGNERNWLGTWFSLGVIIGSIPAQMLQLRCIRPSILIPSCEIAWSALVISMAFAKNIRTVSRILVLTSWLCTF